VTSPIYYPPAVIKPGTTWLQEAKAWLMTHVGLEKDALHVYLALTLVFGSVLLLRWSLRSWKPPALVFAFALAGEIWDIRDGLMTSVPWGSNIAASAHDIWNTMFWPLVILVLARRTALFGPKPEAEPVVAPEDA
jgi:hypothetical protein